MIRIFLLCALGAAACADGGQLQSLGSVSQTQLTYCCDPEAPFPQLIGATQVIVDGGAQGFGLFAGPRFVAIVDAHPSLEFVVDGEAFDPSSDVHTVEDGSTPIPVVIAASACPPEQVGFVVRVTLTDLAGTIVRFEEQRVVVDCILGEPEPEPEPEPGPADGRIAFASDRGGNWEICTMDPDGSNVFNASNAPDTDERDPSWSPDKARIAFLSDRDALLEGDFDLYVMDADGANVQRLTNFSEDGGTVDDPAWSPDGTRIAFVGSFGGPAELWITDVSGASPSTSPTGAGTGVSSPAWSPDSAEIAFVQAGTIRVFDIAANTTELRVGGPFTRREVHWSAAGFVIVSIDFDEDFYRIYRSSEDGADLTKLTTMGYREDSAPVWSGDAARILFVRRPDIGVADELRLYTMNADGTAAAEIPGQSGENDDPDW